MKPRYKKSKYVKHLEELAYKKKLDKTTMPLHTIAIPKYSDNSTNALTRCIIDYVRLLGGYSERVNTQGQYNVKLKKWTMGNTRRGTPDIMASLNGRFLGIEVKYGRDTQSEDQKARQREISASGSLYFLVKDFGSFIEWLITHDFIKDPFKAEVYTSK